MGCSLSRFFFDVFEKKIECKIVCSYELGVMLDRQAVRPTTLGVQCNKMKAIQ